MNRREPETPAAGRRWLGLVVAIVTALGAGAAVFVVVRNASRIRVVAPPVKMEGLTLEAEFARFRSSMKRRLARLERRYEKFRPSEMTPEQDSLARVCDSAFARLRTMVTMFDTVNVPKAATDLRRTVIQDYKTLLRLVSGFARSLDRTPELDSLDRELRRLISE